MKIELWSIGKECDKEIKKLTDEYSKRINRYTKFELKIIDSSKVGTTLPADIQKQKEAEIINKLLTEKDVLICLDEYGKSFTTVQFAKLLENEFNASPQRIIFLIGGSYGINKSILSKAKLCISLSAFTFPHQLVRLIFTEQLYRVFTVMNNEKYHHI